MVEIITTYTTWREQPHNECLYCLNNSFFSIHIWSAQRNDAILRFSHSSRKWAWIEISVCNKRSAYPHFASFYEFIINSRWRIFFLSQPWSAYMNYEEVLTKAYMHLACVSYSLRYPWGRGRRPWEREWAFTAHAICSHSLVAGALEPLFWKLGETELLLPTLCALFRHNRFWYSERISNM